MFGYNLTPFGLMKKELKDYASIYNQHKKWVLPIDWDRITIDLKNNIEKYDESKLKELNELKLEIYLLKEKYDTNFAISTTSLMFAAIAVIFTSVGVIMSGLDPSYELNAEALQEIRKLLYVNLGLLLIVYIYFNRKIEYRKNKEIFLKVYYKIIVSKIELVEKSKEQKLMENQKNERFELIKSMIYAGKPLKKFISIFK